MKNFLPWFCLFLLLTLGISPAVRADDSASIESMVTEEVVAVATVDLTQVKLPQLIRWGVESGLVAESEAKNIKFSATAAQGWVSGLVDSGVQRITVLGQISDIQTQAPIWVATLKTGEDPEVALEALAGTVELLPIKSQALALKGGFVVGGLDQTSVDRWPVDAPQRPEFNKLWQELIECQVGLALFGNKDTRRVVREMLPDLPVPFEEATGELIADDIRWGGVKINLPPDTDAEVVVQSTGPESAKICQRLISVIMKYATKIDDGFSDTQGQLILDALKPALYEDRVQLSLNPLLEKEKLGQLLDAVGDLTAGPRRQSNLKQVILAMHNYEAAKETFPPVAIYNDNGHPLLSWRVAILPYLGQQALYDKFRLDEPWDSPHNLKVARDMPEVYADPENEHHNVNWRTMVQLPYGDGMLSQGKEGAKFSDITDGTSNTIAVVYADPAKAVSWTKPVDWEVDLDNPWNGLKRPKSETVEVAFADTSTHTIKISIPPKDLRAYLTRDGGETIKSDPSWYAR